jgi:lipid-binding SYLF domain-containing protein
MTTKSTAFHLAAFFATLMLAAAPASYAQDKKADARKQLHANVEDTVAQFRKTDPGIDKVLKDAAGYAVFPRIGKAGFIIAGGHGDGELLEKGNATGATSVTLGSVGLTAGVSEYAEILVFQNQASLDRFKQNKFEFSAGASAVVIKTGAAAEAKFNDGVAVFVRPTAGIMAEASVGGQKFKFQADGGMKK